jgi:hypothetical protein
MNLPSMGQSMTLQVILPPDLEQRLRSEADRQGLSTDAMTVQLLDKYLPPADRRAQAVALLQSWIDDTDDGDSDYDLLTALDEGRTSDRKLFPEELKGTSW